MRSTMALLAAALAMAATAGQAQQKQYGPGVTDSEIKIGQSTPLSGPASAFGIYSRVEDAYFKSLNEKGGIDGRKIKFIILDNGFNPPKALEASRKLVEEDGVLAEVGTVGTPTNSAIQKYLNGKKVPQLLVSAGGSKFNDPKQYPWTVPFYPSFEVEAIGYARYALKAQPSAKIAVLYQNDDYGKDFLKGLKKGLGDAGAKAIVAETSYELTDPTVDSQMINLASSGANVFMNFTTPKFAAQALRKANELNWKPMQFIASPGSSVQAVLKVVGFEQSVEGVMTALFFKEPGDPELGQGPGDAGLFRLHEEVSAERIAGSRCDRRVGLRQRPDGRACPQGGQERADPRQPPEAGDDAQGCDLADAVARHGAGQHAGRLSRLSRLPALALRRQGLGQGRIRQGGLKPVMALSEQFDERPDERPGRRRRAPAAKKRRTQAERTQGTRTRILDAAVEVLRKKGYAHFRTADVAKAAGVSRGAQLHHFATKEKLVYATMEHVFTNVLETSRSRARSVRKGDDPLEKVIADGRDFFFSTPFFISLDIATSINSKAFRQKLMGMVRKARLPAEQAWLEALMASGMSEKTADDVLWLTLGLVRGLAIRMLWQDEPERFDRLLKLWRGIVEGYVKESARSSHSSPRIPLPR